ncbi:MAG: hypothetical protein LBV69_01700 [Bacteroidales bacterium]|jgi:UDP-N-acetylglucosamine:LPS N-acetylglucosamine transferase|nr:hypothetical protein [Bacteroidales bacterium]
MSNSKKNILFCPLNWGLGHATRDVPIIKTLLQLEHNVIIGGDGLSIELLKNYFPKQKYIKIYSPSLKYGRKNSFSFLFYCYFARYVFSEIYEKIVLYKIIKKHNIDVIFSDNRFGLFSNKIKTFFISHQLNVFLDVKQKKKSFLPSKVNTYFMKKFDFCLIPDIENKNFSLAGRLSENTENINTFYIGAISRFSKKSIIEESKIKYKFLCILSGPEPQRSILENLLISKFQKSFFNILIIRGLPNYCERKSKINNISFLNYCDDIELLNYFNISEKIICRSGYTSILDLAKIGRRAILIPTPKQPEQEFLAERMKNVHHFLKIKQNCILSTDFERVNYEQIWNFDDNNIDLRIFLNKILKL